MNGGAESMNDTLRQRIAENRDRAPAMTVTLERKRRELAACDAAILDEKRVLRALDRLSELLPKLLASEQKKLFRLVIERVEVSSILQRNLVSLRMKLHLPQLVEGMEERVMTGMSAKTRAIPSACSRHEFRSTGRFCGRFAWHGRNPRSICARRAYRTRWLGTGPKTWTCDETVRTPSNCRG